MRPETREHRRAAPAASPPAADLVAGDLTTDGRGASFRWRWRAALWIFLLALLFRGLYLGEVTRRDASHLLYMDEEYNFQWAKCLATGEWPSPYDQLRTEPYFRAPLYSHFLAGLMLLFGGSLFMIRAVQMILGSISCALAYGVATKCFGSRTGILTGILCALHWVLVYFDGELLLPVLLVLLVLLGFLILHLAAERNSVLLVGTAGLAFGLFAITRPNILAFYPFLLRWSWLDRRDQSHRHAWRFTGALALTLLLPPGLVTVRNGLVSGDWAVVASQGGVNFYIGNNAEANGMDAVVPGTRATWWGGYEDTHRIAEKAMGRTLRPSEVSRYWSDRAFDFIRSEPVPWLRLLGRKIVAWIGDPEVPNNEAYEQRRHEYASLWMPTSFGLLLALFLVSLPWQRATPARFRPTGSAEEERRRRFVALILQFLVVYSLTFLAFFVTGRYRAPMIPLIAIGTALTAVSLFDLARQRQWRRAAVPFTVALLLVIALKIDYLGIREGSLWFAQYNAAVEKTDLGKLDEGIAGFAALLENKIVFDPEVYGTILRAYERRGRSEDKRTMTLLAEYALMLHPLNPDLLRYAMRGHAQAGEWALALQRAEQYTPQAPQDMEGWYVAFRAAHALGRRADAEHSLAEAARYDPRNPLVEAMRRELEGAGR